MFTMTVKIILMVGLAALTGAANAAPIADVLVRPSVEVASAEVRLSDIATVNCSDQGLSARLQAAVICPAPLAGRTHSVSRGQVMTALRRHGLAEATNLLSPAQISVTRRACVVTGEAILDVVRKHVLDQELYPGLVVEVEPVRVPSDQIAPAGAMELRVAERAQSVRKGRNSVPVEIVVDGKVCVSLHVPVTLRVFGQILMAARPISKQESVTTANTAVQDREITYLPDDLLSELPEGEVIAAVPIMEGTHIRRTAVSEPPVVRAGDTVTVAAVGAAIRVSDQGTAVSDGRAGDLIKVRMGTGAREVRGVVAGPGLVEIQIGKRS